MKETRLFLRRFILPIFLILIGLESILLAATGGQNIYFLFGGVMILIVGIVSMIMIQRIIPNTIQNTLILLSIPVVIYTGYRLFRSIQDPIRFEREAKKRYAVVIDNLKQIRDAQVAYKSVYNEYTADFDSLIHFLQTDSFPVIKAIGTVPDTLTEDEAVELGIVSRDTIKVCVLDSIFSPSRPEFKNFRIDSLPYVPFSTSNKFELASGEIERGSVKVKVFEALAKKEVILDGMDENLIAQKKDLKVGSMTEPSINGNWE